MPINEVDGIDDEGNLVGVYWEFVEGANNAFVLDGSTTFSFDYPGAVYTSANGVANGTVTGWYQDNSGFAHAFFWNRGELTKFRFSGSRARPRRHNWIHIWLQDQLTA